jgi:hypothetical protein
MRTLVLDPVTSGLEELMERRRRSGLDRLDEVWEGVYHMIPAPSGGHARIIHQLAVLLDEPARAAGLVPAVGEFNLGDSEDDFRVPDGGVHREEPTGVWHATAALVVEVDPEKQSVDWLGLEQGSYKPIVRSGLIELAPDELAGRIDWPPAA